MTQVKCVQEHGPIEFEITRVNCNCNNAIIYDFTPAYLKPPLQIRVPHLHKAMSPNVTGGTLG